MEPKLLPIDSVPGFEYLKVGMDGVWYRYEEWETLDGGENDESYREKWAELVSQEIKAARGELKAKGWIVPRESGSVPSLRKALPEDCSLRAPSKNYYYEHEYQGGMTEVRWYFKSPVEHASVEKLLEISRVLKGKKTLTQTVKEVSGLDADEFAVWCVMVGLKTK